MSAGFHEANTFAPVTRHLRQSNTRQRLPDSALACDHQKALVQQLRKQILQEHPPQRDMMNPANVRGSAILIVFLLIIGQLWRIVLNAFFKILDAFPDGAAELWQFGRAEQQNNQSSYD